MEKKRNIIPVVRKMTFAEAENADDLYWAKSTIEERLQELIELRKLVFGDVPMRIKKIVSRRSIYEEEN